MKRIYIRSIYTFSFSRKGKENYSTFSFRREP
nr:MAG TPA: Protein of unknown function (DUF3301) [Caudoviricetes sp.]DAX12137.1 MAG TPA: Protein of unknown function (DUF3301) [Bacteriophage sp.]